MLKDLRPIAALLFVCSITPVETASAQQRCPSTVVFGSGIDTTQDDANTSLRILAWEVRHYLQSVERDLPAECFKALAAKPQGQIIDILESANQQAQERFRDWWRWYFGEGEPSLEFEQLYIDDLKAFSLDAEQTKQDLSTHLEAYRDILYTGSNVILVAHSQGNLFGGEAFRVLTETEGVDARKFSEVPLASPSTSTVKDTAHWTFYGDIILWVPGHRPANTDAAGTPCIPNPVNRSLPPVPLFNGVVCHSFQQSYLLSTVVKPAILTRIETLIPRPQMQSDHYSISQGQTLTVNAPGVLVNDTLLSPLKSISFFRPPDGFSNLGSGGFSYKPDASTLGVVQITYIVKTAVDTASSNVFVDVAASPVSTPAAIDDGPFSMSQGGVLTVPAPGVLGNDTYPTGSTVEFLAPLPTGLAAANPDGSFTIDLSGTPAFTGTITLHYVIQSVHGDSNIATVTVQVKPVPTTTIYDGNWAGSTGQGWPFTFQVSAGRVVQLTVQYTLPAGPGLCSGNGSAGLSPNPGIVINGNSFTFQGQPVTSLTGTFGSASSATGSLTITQPGFGTCPNTNSVTTTWTATNAVVIFSNLGPGDGFGQLTVNSGGSISADESLAVPFIPTFTTQLASIELGVEDYSPFGGGFVNSHRVRVVTDDAGLPSGTVLESIDGLAFPPYRATELTLVNSRTHPVLHAGVKYWVVVGPVGTSDPPTHGGWLGTDSGAIGLAAINSWGGWQWSYVGVVPSVPPMISGALRVKGY